MFNFDSIEPGNIPALIREQESHVHRGEPIVAFAGFLKLALDGPEQWRAYCWFWLGELVAQVPDLNPLDSDSGGIFYYRRALSNDSNCANAWAAVLIEYTPEPWGHHDRSLAIRAVEFFLADENSWPHDLLELVKERRDMHNL